MTRGFLSLLALSLCVIAPAGAQDARGSGASAPARPALTKVDHPGRVLFERNCAACHGAGPGDDGSPMLPGTAALERKYRGQVPGALELRSGLGPEVISVFVRQGIGAMPPFRKSELSDAQIEAIAAYLEASARANQR